MTFSIQVLGTSSGIPLTFPCPSRDQPPPEAVGPVPCSHLSHRMHCISGGALQCNEHVLHCVALFFSEPESSSSLCSWPLLLTLSVQRVSNVAFSSTCTVVVYCSWVLNSCMRWWCRLHWCSALLYCSLVPGFELLYALVQCTIMLTPRVLHFAARLSVIYAFGRAALFVCPTCGDDHAFPDRSLESPLKGL